jgi:purine-binding chemotaxis protein CheW
MSDFEDIYADDSDETAEHQQLVFSAENVNFALPVTAVREMLPVQEVVHIPNAPEWVRGIINVRSETFRLVDFRKRVGMMGLEEEENALIEELDKREREHKQWIDKLEEAVTNNREFEGETDPHKCNFGRWYDNYQSPNAEVMFELKKFDKPHRAIHKAAEEALALKNEGKHDEAIALIDNRRNGELARLVTLFDTLKATIKSGRKEVIVLVETDTDKYAIVVDKVEVVESLRISGESTLATFQTDARGFARHAQVARREKEDDIVYLVEPGWIIQGAEEVSADSTAEAHAD